MFWEILQETVWPYFSFEEVKKLKSSQATVYEYRAILPLFLHKNLGEFLAPT